MIQPRPGPLALATALVLATLAGCASAPASSPMGAPVAPVGIDLAPVAEHPQPRALPAGWRTGAFMEVFVRGYQDSDGDGIGDLRGLTQRLDYLRDLGIRGLWLMPITRSADHDHGYAVADFRSLEPAYGTLADLDALVREAHARGIAIVMDYVINHSASEDPLFVASASSRDSPYRGWYVWEDTHPPGWDIFGHDPWTSTRNGAYFAQFGSPMPDFNLRNPAVVAYHRDSLRFWLNHGIDGFRIDAVGHLFENGKDGWSLQKENYAFMRALRASLAAYPDTYWVCESPGDPLGFGRDDACGASFAFGQSDHLVKAARGDVDAIRAVADYWLTAPPGMATMVSNHDAFAGHRLWDAMHGDPSRVRLAAATYLLQPGTPYIYYGEELGMGATASLDDDWKLRGPVSWTADPRTAGFTIGMPYRPPSINVAANNAAAEAQDPQSLLAFYRDMLRLRNTLPSLGRGSYEAPQVDGQVMSFQRRWRDGAGGAQDHTLVVLNYGTQPARATVAGLGAQARVTRVYPAPAAGAPDATVTATGGKIYLAATALSVQVFRVDD